MRVVAFEFGTYFVVAGKALGLDTVLVQKFRIGTSVRVVAGDAFSSSFERRMDFFILKLRIELRVAGLAKCTSLLLKRNKSRPVGILLHLVATHAVGHFERRMQTRRIFDGLVAAKAQVFVKRFQPRMFSRRALSAAPKAGQEGLCPRIRFFGAFMENLFALFSGFFLCLRRECRKDHKANQQNRKEYPKEA